SPYKQRRPAKLVAPAFAILGSVMPVDGYVVVAQVTGPDRRLTVAQPAVKQQAHRWLRNDLGRLGFAVLGGDTPVEQTQAKRAGIAGFAGSNPESSSLRVQRNTRSPGGSDNPAPVCVAAIERSFDQRRCGNGIADLLRRCV